LRHDFVVLIADFPHNRYFSIIRLAQQSGKPGGIQQRILSSVHRHHAKAESLLSDR
jgi:hypothetical protein